LVAQRPSGCPRPVRRVAPGSSRGAPARRQARGIAPRRNSAPRRRSAPAGPEPDRHRRRDAPSPRAEPRRQRTREPSRQARLLGVDRFAGMASAAGLLANATTVTGRNGPPGGPGRDQAARVTGATRLGFAQVTGLPAPVQRPEPGVLPAPTAGEHARSEHTYGGPPGRRCCAFLLYPLFEPFELSL
jgi:hypothetical protein